MEAFEVVENTQDNVADADLVTVKQSGKKLSFFKLSKIWDWVKTKTASTVTASDKTPVNSDGVTSYVNGALTNYCERKESVTYDGDTSNFDAFVKWILDSCTHNTVGGVMWSGQNYFSYYVGITPNGGKIGTLSTGTTNWSIYYINGSYGSYQIALKSDLTNMYRQVYLNQTSLNLNDCHSENIIYYGDYGKFFNLPADISNFDNSQGIEIFIENKGSAYRSYTIQSCTAIGYYQGTWATKTYRRMHVDVTWLSDWKEVESLRW